MLRILSPKKLIPLSFIKSSHFITDSAVFNLNNENEHRIKKQETGNINEDFLKNMVCPLTKKPLIYDNQRQLLINNELLIGYKIENGIPNMIPTEAIKLEKS